MRCRKKFKLITILAALLLTLTSCALQAAAPIHDSDGGESPPDEPDSVGSLPEGYTAADTVFSIKYSPTSSLNPFLGTDIYNDQLFGLLYEGLFALDGNLRPVPVLCDSFSTEDGITYELTLKSGVSFHDGSTLTSSDAVYSLNIAKDTAKYSSRLEDIVSVGEIDGLSLRITLSRANYSLPALLDVPIIKNGSADEPQPAGTGPYIMGEGRLTAFSAYRDYRSDSLGVIYLRDCPPENLAESFSDRSVDLVGYDPTGLLNFNVHMVHETRYYDTTDFLYLGFNCSAGVTSVSGVRRALAYLVNTDAICEDIFKRSVLRSPLVLSPTVDVYDTSWEADLGYSRQQFSRLASSFGIEDSNSDGYLEYTSGSGEFTLRFIVNSDSSYKVAAAERIATDMQNMGIHVELDVLSWDDYVDALKNGDFSMYLGEAFLKADFDMTALLAGGSLNYGRISDERYGALIDAFLAAPDEASRTAAAKELCLYVASDAPIVPIAYKEYAVLSHVGIISGGSPSQSNIFLNISSWQFNI